MFIAQAYKAKHEFWRYLIGSLVVAVAAFIGQLPLVFIMIFKLVQSGSDLGALNESNMFDILEPNLFLFLIA